MDVDHEYLVYLENRIRCRENSRSYRWTVLFRLIWNCIYPHRQSDYDKTFDTIYRNRLIGADEDLQVIQDSGKFDAGYACPWIKDDEHLALTEYLSRWNRKTYLRKPRPGFHPGIYAQSTECAAEPFSHYLRAGSPEGPWSFPVISHREPTPSDAWNTKVALHLHIYYVDQVDNILKRFSRNTSRPDLFISVRSDEDKREVEQKLGGLGFHHAVVKTFPNRGRNFGPLFTGFKEIFSDYEIVGHIHTKQSPHLTDREYVHRWQGFLLDNTLGDHRPSMDSIIAAISRDKSLGLVFPDDPNVLGWFKNTPYARELAPKLGMHHFTPCQYINFPAGSMFWARTRALQPVLDLKLNWDDYPIEPMDNDGSMLHALERMIPDIVLHTGHKNSVTYLEGTSY